LAAATLLAGAAADGWEAAGLFRAVPDFDEGDLGDVVRDEGDVVRGVVRGVGDLPEVPPRRGGGVATVSPRP
jgi:hypothetical protein